MVYGLYKNVRNAAWQCLLDFNITALPTDILYIADKVGIKIVKNSEVGVLAPNEIGLSISNGNQWYIVYKDTESRQQCRYISRSQAYKRQYTKRSDEVESIEEKEADTFASRLLAPACVIWALDIHKADDIASLCDISDFPAKQRAARMRTLYKRDKFLLSDLEKEVFDNFEEFINKQKIPAELQLSKDFK